MELTAFDIANALLQEITEFNDLLDTRENIRCIPTTLNNKGRNINYYLHDMGILNEYQVEQLSKLLYAFKLETERHHRIEII